MITFICLQFSNVIFFLFPPVLMHLFQEYSKFCNPAINILWVLLMVIGLSSAYFHATLSLVGKLIRLNFTSTTYNITKAKVCDVPIS